MRSLLLFLLLLPSSFAQQISVNVTPRNPLTAEVVRVEVEVIAPKAVPVELPDSVHLDCAMVTDASDSAPEAASAGRIRYRRTFVLDLNGPGPCRVPPLPVLYGEAELSTQEVVFDVRSAIGPEEGPDPDINDQLAIVPFYSSTPGGWTVAAFVTLALLGIGTAIWVLSRRTRIPSESVEAAARRRFSELAAAPPAPPREFYNAVSAILAEYMRRRFHLHSGSCTSTEILEALRRMRVVTAECDAALACLLAECDRGRYAASQGSETDPAAAVALGRNIIDSLGAQAASTPWLVRAWEGHAPV